MQSGLGIYYAEDSEIVLNPDLGSHLRLERVVAQVYKWHGIGIGKQDAPVWVFLHELGHHVRRRHTLHLSGK